MPLTGQPAFRRIAGELRAQIEGGELTEGSQLPSMAQLRETYSVSSTVVRDAINELRRDGLVIGQQGKGVFVANPDDARPADNADLASRVDQLERRVKALEDRDRS